MRDSLSIYIDSRAYALDSLSGRRDSNSRPPAPKAGILTGLNYYPLGFAERVVDRSSEAR